MDRVFRQSNDRLDNSQLPSHAFHADQPRLATVNARFMAYLEQIYAPRNPRRLFALTFGIIAGACLATVATLVLLPQAQALWPLLALETALITRLAMMLHRRLGTRHRLFRVRDVIENGVLVTGYVFQAPPALFQTGNDNLPALVLFSFQPEVAQDPAYMRYLVRQLHYAHAAVVTAENRSQMTFATAKPGVLYRRRLLPLSLTDGSAVYCADVWINRTYLRDGCLDGTALPLLAQTGEQGGVELVPWWLTSTPASARQESGLYAAS